jgi:hypothetical protein
MFVTNNDFRIWDQNNDASTKDQQPQICAVFNNGTRKCKNAITNGRSGPLKFAFSKNELGCNSLKVVFNQSIRISCFLV